VKLSYRWFALITPLLCCVAMAAPMPKDKEKEPEGKKVDSGSFGIFQNGHRVGTETFSIYETGNGSVIKSEFKTENTPPDVQSSEMQLAANGDIRRYEWKELSPERGESVLLPNDDFLTQKWRASPQEKEHEQPYLLPLSTTILDDYFFIDREILAWRFLASACKQDKGVLQCPLRQRAQFGTINPHQHSSAPLAMESLGREMLSLKNGPRDLIKLELKTDAGAWQLWIDDQNQWRVMRMLVEGENTVVERD
jgi:hypothetical protein